MAAPVTTPALDSIRKLRRIAAALESGRAPDPGDGAWLAAGLRDYFDGAERGLSIEMAFCLSPAPGFMPWWGVERRDRRDVALAQIITKHFSDLSPPRAAAALAVEWRQYQRSAQAADLQRGYSAAAPDSLRADLFRLVRLGDLPGERRLADIFKANIEGDAA